MSDQNKLKWLTRRISTLTRTGQLILTNEKQVDLRMLSSQVFHQSVKLLKYFDLRGTSIKSLEGLPYLPNLHTFLADSTQISSFENFRSIRNATKLSFKKTPLSDFPKYKLSLLIICGNKLSSIDNAVIPNSLRHKAQDYPQPIAAELIESGWIVEIPCPEEDRFEELCDQYEIANLQERKDKKEMKTIELADKENNSMSNETDEFDLVIQEYHNKQDAMFIQAEALFDIVPERNIEAELAEEISNLFGKHGIAVDANNDELVLQAVEDLCKRATTQGDTPSSITEEEEI